MPVRLIQQLRGKVGRPASSVLGALLALSTNLPAPAQEGGIKEYHITCDPDSFSYIYGNWKRDHYVPIHLTHRGRTWRDAEMRIRGDSSRELPKKSLKIRFPSTPFHDGNDRINFNAEYLDPSYLRTVLTSRLFRDTRHPAFLAEHARLFLNGAFLGLYVKVENMDEHFLRRNRLHRGGNLYKATLDGACLSTMDDADHHWEKKTNESEDRDDLRNLIFLINAVPDKEYLNFSHSYLAYDGMVNIIALNMLLSNGSTYYHNYYMFHDIMGTGKWSMFPWDTDRTFSRYGWNLPYHQSGQPRHLHRWDNPFLERALQDETILGDIRSRIDQLSLTWFSPGHLFPIMDSLEVLLESTIPLDRADDVAGLAQWRSHMAEDRAYIESRHSRLERQFEDWPSPFGTLPLRWIEDDPWLVWRSSEGASTYTLKYGKDPQFLDSDVRMAEGLTDTAFALPPGLPPGRYFWNVEAINSHGSMVAFDSRSTFALPRRPVPGERPVMINELNYHSADDFDPGDWVELHNPHARSLDLSGWYLKDGREDHVFFLPRSTFIVGKGYLVLCQEKEDFLALFPEVEACLGGWDFGLGRYAESVRLFDAGGNLVDSLTYGSEAPWPSEANGTGSTLQLIDPGLDNSLAANWGLSGPYGTPGASNAPISLEPGVALRSYPNPFGRSVTLLFALQEGARCSVAIVDIRGAQVAKLVDEWRPAGLHQVDWDGYDGEGKRAASGVYLARLSLATGSVKSSKVVLLR